MLTMANYGLLCCDRRGVVIVGAVVGRSFSTFLPRMHLCYRALRFLKLIIYPLSVRSVRHAYPCPELL